MRAKLSFISLVVLFFVMVKGCSTEVCGCVHFDTQIQLNVVDQKGNSFFNQSSPHTLTSDDIDLFYEEQDGRASINNDFDIIRRPSEQTYFMVFNADIDSDQNPYIVYIEFNDSDMDTIKTVHQEEDGLTQVTHVWYNGESRWNLEEDRKENLQRHIVVTKDWE